MNDWSGRRVFVTGGNGLLGVPLVRMLLERGARVVCLIKEDRLGSPFGNVGDRVVRVRGVVEEFKLLRDTITSQGVDTIFHLAAQPIVLEARKDPLPAIESNVRGTYNLLEAARQRGGIRAFVLASSDKVYGDAVVLPYIESHALLGRDPYDASKVCADVLAQSYMRFGLPIGIARAGNLYGPGDLQWSRIVPATIRSLHRGERPVLRSDGALVRDYFYVEDAAAGFLALGEALDRPNLCAGAYNFGTGVPTRVIDLVRMLVKRSGRDVEPIVEATARNEIKVQYLDCAKAKRLLGWECKTTLAEGIEKTWVWYEKFFVNEKAVA